MRTDIDTDQTTQDPNRIIRKPSIVSGVPSRRSIANRRSSQRRLNLKDLNYHKVLLLSMIFAMVFSPFNGIQNILHGLMKEYEYTNIGLLSLAVFYLAFGIGSFFTPQLSTKLDYKFSFCLSIAPMVSFFGAMWLLISCSDNNYSICNTSTMYLLVFGSATIAGFGTSLLYIVQSIYLTDCSNPINKNKMFGMISTSSQLAQALGAIFTCLLLPNFGASPFFVIVIILCSAAAVLALWLRTPEKDTENPEYFMEVPLTFPLQEAAGSNNDLEAKLLQQKSDVSIPQMDSFTSKFFWNCLNKNKMTIFYPLFLASACNFSLFVSYLASDVYEVLKQKSDSEDLYFSRKLMQIVLVFFALGLGELFSGKVFASRIYSNKRDALSLTYKIFIACGILHIIFNSIGSYILYIPLGFLYGLGDAGSRDVIAGAISMKFIERFEPFTCFRIVYFTSLGGFFILHLLIMKGAPTVSFIFFIFLTLYAWVNNYRFFTRSTPDG